MSARPPLVRFESVSKRYGDGALVLDRLSFEVTRGEFVALLGPSGCGKSTLLRLVSSLSPISSGQLTVDGKAPETVREEMGFIFQEATLLPWLTVTQNIDVPLSLRGLPRTQRAEKTAALRARVGLDHVPGHYPRQLSGGMKMRVSLARALALSPKILLMDEPFGALDEMTRDRMNEELLTLREQEAFTAFFVTHSVAEAVFLSSRVLLFSANPGRLYRDLPVPLVYPRTPETRDTAEYRQLVAEISACLREACSTHP